MNKLDFDSWRGRSASSAVLALALSACAGYGTGSLRGGETADQVIANMGRPTARYARPGGERLEFARGPMGTHTFMVDLDAAGKVTTWRQVLTMADFAQIKPGLSRDDVLMRIGTPGEVSHIYFHHHRVLWSYRYETPLCEWFQIEIDDSGKVIEAAYPIDPRCANDISGGM
jgi:outer membrane protein assembly factor BamE (lipoprotein component of BamABCDE complex)